MGSALATGLAPTHSHIMEGDSDEYDVAEVDFMDDDNLIVSGIKLTATRNPPRSYQPSCCFTQTCYVFFYDGCWSGVNDGDLAREIYLRRDCLRLLHNKSPLPSKRSGVRVRCGTNAAASYLPGRHRVPTPFNHLDLNDFPFFPLLLLFGYNK